MDKISQQEAFDRNPFFKKEDVDELLRSVFFEQDVTLDRTGRKLVAELAQTFIEEVLDVSATDKSALTQNAIERQIALKFPEVARETYHTHIELMQHRGAEIEKNLD